MRFDDKVAFITGGGIGFGRAFARALGAEGAVDRRRRHRPRHGRGAAAELEAAGTPALGVGCDVADEHQVEAAVASAIREFGGIDILINNAGLHLMKYNQPFGVLSRNDVRALFDVNVIGVINCTLACPPFDARPGAAA